uniref:Lipocalin/cytosolic fatty-acid binding domain-containing protein n=1 Tax=Amblyomma maculatum TaxID=34609 RepID=G3MRM4_AMBMU
MLICVLAFLPFISTFHGATAGQPYGETRMDYDKAYIEHQDIIKAFNRSLKQWLYGTNFKIPQSYDDYKCISFKKDNVSMTQLNFTAYYLKDSQPGLKQLYGTLCKYNGDADADTVKLRKQPNCIKLSVTKGTPEEEFRLIYSDYQKCSILRAPSQQSGKGCIVLLTVSAVRTGLPKTCNATYQNLCGTEYTFHKVFDDNCKLT